jgi:ribonuclease P protein component
VHAPGERGESHGERLPRARRISSGSEIRHIVQRGKRSRTVHLDVFDSASPASYARVGVVVPRHRHTVVERNRVKRRLREILRRFILPALDRGGCALDVLVRARREAYGVSFEQLRDELAGWVDRRCSRAFSSS